MKKYFQYAENMFPLFFAILKFCSTKHLFNGNKYVFLNTETSKMMIHVLTGVFQVDMTKIFEEEIYKGLVEMSSKVWSPMNA